MVEPNGEEPLKTDDILIEEEYDRKFVANISELEDLKNRIGLPKVSENKE